MPLNTKIKFNKSQNKMLFYSYLIGLLLVYIILVLDNLNWNLFEDKLPEKFLWSLTTEFTNWQDPLTMVIFALLFVLILKKKIKRRYLYLLGFLFTYLILSINNVLWNTEGIEWYKNMISIFEWKQDWLTMLIGAFIFLLFYSSTSILKEGRNDIDQMIRV